MTLPPMPAAPATPDPVPVLLGRVYAEAPTLLKRRLLAHLLKPLGLLSLATVCNGAFAQLAFSRDGSHRSILPEMAQSVDAEQVRTLTDYVQQVSVQAISGLAQVLTASPASPVIQGSVAATALVALLIQRAREQPKPSPRELEDFAP